MLLVGAFGRRESGGGRERREKEGGVVKGEAAEEVEVEGRWAARVEKWYESDETQGGATHLG